MINKPVERKEQESANKEATAREIDDHRQAAAHHIEAARHHIEAAENHEKEDHDKAAHHTVVALGHSEIAGRFVSDNAKRHAQALKETKHQ